MGGAFLLRDLREFGLDCHCICLQAGYINTNLGPRRSAEETRARRNPRRSKYLQINHLILLVVVTSRIPFLSFPSLPPGARTNKNQKKKKKKEIDRNGSNNPSADGRAAWRMHGIFPFSLQGSGSPKAYQQRSEGHLNLELILLCCLLCSALRCVAMGARTTKPPWGKLYITTIANQT